MSATSAISESAAGASASPFDLRESRAYGAWRKRKLESYPRSAGEISVEVADLANPNAQERAAILHACDRSNMALYKTSPNKDAAAGRAAIRDFGRGFGLVAAEDHRSAEHDGIVRIEVVAGGGRLGYIPYTDRPINWHTDGYYNYHGEGNFIQAMVLHCVRPAVAGGANRLLDPEIAYLRLRDEDPDLVAALMRRDAMAIPANREPDGRTRPTNVGPVFFLDPTFGRLAMRYTARKRNVIWRDDAVTRRAAVRLEELLEAEPLTLTLQLQAGEGVICNNVLHDRSAFETASSEGARLFYRVRYHNRVAEI